MWLLKNRTRGFYLCFVLLLAMVIGGSAITYADSGTAKVAVKAGNLTESNATNPVSLGVNKGMRLATYTLPIAVIDARGSGKGWKLSITSTRFMLNDKDKDLLPSDASSIVKVSASCSGVGGHCTIPANQISYPLPVPAGTTPPSPVKFFDAAVSTGLGKFGLMMLVNVTIPANTEQGTYTSTITLAIASGP
jgi:hypothetical protein